MPRKPKPIKPVLLVAFLRRPRRRPLWVPHGSCIIPYSGEGWSLGPLRRTRDASLLVVADNVFDLARDDMRGAIRAWKASMPTRTARSKVEWNVWAWDLTQGRWLSPRDIVRACSPRQSRRY